MKKNVLIQFKNVNKVNKKKIYKIIFHYIIK